MIVKVELPEIADNILQFAVAQLDANGYTNIQLLINGSVTFERDEQQYKMRAIRFTTKEEGE